MLKTYAPIILFTYNRPKHTIQTIQALSANPLALKSDLYIYQDAPKPNASKDILQSHTQTKNYIQDFITNNTQKPLFKSITFIEREYNLGLADSIIDVFLDYMNAALQRYENEPKVWSIAAWSYPIDTSGLGDCYFWRLPHCWGWATWASRWQYYKRDITWALENFSQSDIDYINIDGVAHYYDHLLANAQGKIKTWAIFNYLIGYKHNALNLCPSTSYIKQIGFDGSGVHCGQEGEVFNTSHINTKFPITFPQEIIESPLALERIKAFELSLKKPLPLRIYKKLRRITHSLSQKVSYLSGGGVVNNILALDTPPYYEKGA